MVGRVKKPNSQNKNKIQNFDNVQNSEFSFLFWQSARISVLSVQPFLFWQSARSNIQGYSSSSSIPTKLTYLRHLSIMAVMSSGS